MLIGESTGQALATFSLCMSTLLADKTLHT